jgi:hypothetical protein
MVGFIASAAAEQCSYRFAEVGQPEKGDYSGECKNGKAHGHGKVSYDDGATWSEGEYRKGQRDGKSITVWANGDRYEGEYRKGKQHGKGAFTWSNGNTYVGEYRDGKLQGRGTFTWADGARYVGNFSENGMNGHGTHYSKEGDRQVGYWKNGGLWDGWVYGANGSVCEVKKHKSVIEGCVDFD